VQNLPQNPRDLTSPKKGLAAGSHQALLNLQGLKGWNWEEHPTKDKISEQQCP